MAEKGGRKLKIYVDCVSPYSWFGFTNTIRYRPALRDHGVDVDIIPFFLGAARDGVGNPWQPTVQAKVAFGMQDSHETGRLLGLDVVPPKVFPISSLFPVRVATYVKDHYPAAKFEATFPALSSGYWSKSINISTVEGVIKALDGIFTKSELEDVLKGAVTPENKKRVVEQTMGSGAFGAPWIVAVNAKGGERSWFGNDRWDQVLAFLEVPYKGVTILPASSKL